MRQGVLSLQQPVVAPLYSTRQREAILLHWARPDVEFAENLYLEFLKKRWETTVYPGAGQGTGLFSAFWHSALHDGVYLAPTGTKQPLRFDPAAVSRVRVPAAGSGWVVSVGEPYYLGDGQFAGNGWLQELPASGVEGRLGQLRGRFAGDGLGPRV